MQEREDFMASDSTTSRERSGSPPTSPVAVAGSSSTGLPRTSAVDLDLEREVSVSPPPLHSGRVKEIAWYSWREWHDVYADVFSENLLKCCTALLTMGCWKERKSRLPVAVVGTMELKRLLIADAVECWNVDGEFKDRKPGAGIENVHLAYGMAIVRLVNGLVDHYQTGKYARSVNKIAQTELGLPQWIVDIRHRATHDIMPSLDTMREGAKFLLGYLRKNYWQVQSASIFAEIDDRMQRKEPHIAQHAICACARAVSIPGGAAARVEGPKTRDAAKSYEPEDGPKTPAECAEEVIAFYSKQLGPKIVARQLVDGFKGSDGSSVGLLSERLDTSAGMRDDNACWRAWDALGLFRAPSAVVEGFFGNASCGTMRNLYRG